MSPRVMIAGLLSLAGVLGGGLWWYMGNLRALEEADQAKRLATATVYERPAPKFVEPVFHPVTQIKPVFGGKVLRAADDSPLGEAIVEVIGAPGADGVPVVLGHTSTVPAGDFVFTALAPDPVALRVWFPVGYKPKEPMPAGHPGFLMGQCVVQTVPLAPGDAQRLDLVARVDTGWVLRGTLMSTTGKAVEDGMLSLTDPHVVMQAESDGSYVIRDLPRDGEPIGIMASGARVCEERLTATQPADGSAVLSFDIQLDPAGMIHGRVHWRKGLTKPANLPVVMLLNPPASPDGEEPKRPVAFVDGEGSYRLDGLRPGRWDLSCAWTASEGLVQRTWTSYARGVQVGPGETVLHEFVLPPNCTVDVTVTGSDGAPLGKQVVEVSHVLDAADPESPVLREVVAETTPQGTFTLDEMAPGTKELRVLAPRPLEPGATQPEYDVRATQRVEVHDGVNTVSIVVAQ